jgi:hypothetical protein
MAEAADVEAARGVRGVRLGQLAGLAQGLDADGAVEQAGVQVRQAVELGQPLGDGSLAGGGGAVDGDDQVHAGSMAAPRPRIKSAKPGKLVAIISAPSTVTGP